MAENPQNIDNERKKIHDHNRIYNEEEMQIKQAIELSILDDKQRKKEMTEEERQFQVKMKRKL